MKIALCIPCHGDTKAKFTQSLAAMIVHTLGANIVFKGERAVPEIEIFMVSCSLLPESRNRLVAEAIHWGADYMLWMDADHVFPRDALLRLLSHGLLVVGCNYARRFTPIWEGLDGGLLWTDKAKFDAGLVEECAHLGLGFCLMDMRVFGVLDHKAIEAGKNDFWPLFRLDPKENGVGFYGEDVHFFRIIREAGISVNVDHGLSWDVGHIDEHILTNAHAVIQRERFLVHDKTRLDKFKTDDSVTTEAA
jgi:hypothetical protein